MEFAKSSFAQFISGIGGRLLRIVAGAAIIAAGILWVGGTLGWVLAVVGIVPITAGVFDFCLLGPLFKAPFLGRDIRAADR